MRNEKPSVHAAITQLSRRYHMRLLHMLAPYVLRIGPGPNRLPRRPRWGKMAAPEAGVSIMSLIYIATLRRVLEGCFCWWSRPEQP